MQLFVIILHIILCAALIMVILLQPGKEGATAFGGGGGNSAYGARSNAHPLARATTVVAVLFMFTSITLALYSSESVRAGSDIEDDLMRLQREMEEQTPKFNAVSSKSEEPAIPEPSPEEAADPAVGGEAGDVTPDGAPADATTLPVEASTSEGTATEAPKDGAP